QPYNIGHQPCWALIEWPVFPLCLYPPVTLLLPFIPPRSGPFLNQIPEQGEMLSAYLDELVGNKDHVLELEELNAAFGNSVAREILSRLYGQDITPSELAWIFQGFALEKQIHFKESMISEKDRESKKWVLQDLSHWLTYLDKVCPQERVKALVE